MAWREGLRGQELHATDVGAGHFFQVGLCLLRLRPWGLAGWLLMDAFATPPTKVVEDAFQKER
eukprot:11596111-Alexandrium_andersonii.AAC.1